MFIILVVKELVGVWYIEFVDKGRAILFYFELQDNLRFIAY